MIAEGIWRAGRGEGILYLLGPAAGRPSYIPSPSVTYIIKLYHVVCAFILSSKTFFLFNILYVPPVSGAQLGVPGGA